MVGHCCVSRRLAVLALLALTPALSRAADAWPVARGPSREPAPYRYDPTEAEITTRHS